MSIKAALRQARAKLKEHGCGTPDLDAEVLLAHVTGLDRAGLYRRWERNLAAEEETCFQELVGRRCAGEPVAYLTGHREFMGLGFTVNSSVLIPRPETELLVETALKLLPPAPVVVDVGTGSGAIAVSLSYFRPKARVYALDCSAEALAVARLNAARHGLRDRITFCRGDLLEALDRCGAAPVGTVDLIAANLPYIAESDLPGLPREVRLFEPALALDGGPDGLDPYRRLIPAAALYLKPGGWLLMEIGCLQGPAAAALFPPSTWSTAVLQDLAGLDRLVAARLKGDA